MTRTGIISVIVVVILGIIAFLIAVPRPEARIDMGWRDLEGVDSV